MESCQLCGYAAALALGFLAARLLARWGEPKRCVGQPATAQPLAPGEKRPDQRRAEWRDATDVDVLVIGGSSAGLTMAAKLEQQDPASSASPSRYLVLERNAKCGDAWRSRYERLHLHTANAISHLPGLPFPSWYPTFVGKDRLADYYDACAALLRVRCGVEVDRARFDAGSGRWAVHAHCVASGEALRFSAGALVVCTGQESAPRVPEFPGAADFKGRILHSSDWTNGEEFRGQNVLVVGSGNSGAEICLDLYEHSAKSVAMVARSPTHIVHRDASEMLATSVPFWFARRVLPVAVHNAGARMGYWLDPKVSDVTKLGFRLRSSGLITDLVTKHEAPLQDIGTLDLVRQGHVRVVAAGVRRFTERGAEFDGEAEAPLEDLDAIVLATGYHKGSASHHRFLDEALCQAALNEHGVVRSGLGPVRLNGVSQRLYFVGMDDMLGRLREMHCDCDTALRDLL